MYILPNILNICTLGFYSVHSWSEQHSMKSSIDNVILSYVYQSSTLVWIRQDQSKFLSKYMLSQSAANVNPGEVQNDLICESTQIS